MGVIGGDRGVLGAILTCRGRQLPVSGPWGAGTGEGGVPGTRLPSWVFRVVVGEEIPACTGLACRGLSESHSVFKRMGTVSVAATPPVLSGPAPPPPDPKPPTPEPPSLSKEPVSGRRSLVVVELACHLVAGPGAVAPAAARCATSPLTPPHQHPKHLGCGCSPLRHLGPRSSRPDTPHFLSGPGYGALGGLGKLST